MTLGDHLPAGRLRDREGLSLPPCTNLGNPVNGLD